MKYTALGESLVTNTALQLVATQLSPRAVYFIQSLQTGGSALSNTYCCHIY